ncbi:MAG: ABC transporter permease [Caldilineaceae bacterium SB0661_bin_32]|uniref:ABC transporter permease n=1 Tax=Caldilineaceae bacterium SB0661_bin_32 TaxID=2605255 RepID=A0A6B1D399_9CHLR|nr:ABC transporter permease [Caldilineaceae bacterium SB0661_bin_32]
MSSFIFRRLLLLAPTLFLISLISFVIIELPPGDYVTSYIANRMAMGDAVRQDEIDALIKRYGLDQPAPVRYTKWLGNALRGDFGFSFEWELPVSDLIWDRLGLTVMVAFAALMFSWIIGLVVGIFSAVYQYSIADYIFTALSFIGLGTPNFMLALILMWIAFSQFGLDISGLFSQEFVDEPWSIAKFVDMLKHLWAPAIIVGTAGSAGLVRTMRANLLDELSKPYVETGRAKGMNETRLVLKYPTRVALNPFVSTMGWALPQLVSGSIIVSVVLSLPTTGPLLLRALLTQDMYLASSFLLMLSTLTIIGTLVSDIMLALLDPRIRMGG